MMKHEFEALAGYEVSSKDYDEIIEPMYTATNLSKQEFVKCIDSKRFALKTEKQIINEMKKLANLRKETCDHYTDYDAVEKLCALKDELVERFYFGCFALLDNCYHNEYGRGCSWEGKMTICKSNGRIMKEIVLA